METLVILPLPPSANRLWRIMRGKPVKSPAYRAWRDEASDRIAHQVAGHVPLSWFSVAMDMPMTRRDPDNAIKPILDACQHAGLIVNDGMLRGLTLDVLDAADPDTVRVRLFDAPIPAAVTAKETAQRRAWEAATALANDFRDQMTPGALGRALRMRKLTPEAIPLTQAEAMLRLAERVMGGRV